MAEVHGGVRIGNCSGFYGDRLSAMREMLEGGRLDYLTGDYLAELTMLILGRDQLKDPGAGYAKTFLRQLEDCLALALETGVRIVSNAGGLNPAGLAAAVDALGTGARVAYVDGDDLRGGLPEAPGALTANAYLGAFGIARALAAGADVVVTGRVTDASVVVGPAIAHHGWARTDLDALAGAVVAGHVIECGTQATGGNFAGFRDLRLDRQRAPLGFPVAEIAIDGSSVITKHAGTGGAVTVDTVTAQLLYEVQGSRYLGPDVTTDLTTIRLDQAGPDRVAISGVRGEAPPAQLKVAVNELGGFRNCVEFVVTGLDIEAKADWLRSQLEATLPAGPDYAWSTYRLPAPDSPTEEGAACLLRLIARAADADAVGRGFTGPAIELALASYPGFHVTAPPGRPAPYGVFTAAYVDRDAVTETVHLWDGTTELISAPAVLDGSDHSCRLDADRPAESAYMCADSAAWRPLGELLYARSGDKGGDANLGLWVPQHRPDAAVEWLLATATPAWVRSLIPEAAELAIDVVPLANLRGVNIVLHGLLGDGVAASTRFDPQAKALGEWVRSRHAPIPEELLDE